MENTKGLIDFIRKSPDAYHAVKTISEHLEANGFKELSENAPWEIRHGGKYFVTRNMSSLIAFAVPEAEYNAFYIAASHTDSPAFKLKGNFEAEEGGALMNLIAECAGVGEKDIKGFDLSLYNRMTGTVLGTGNEYFSAPRIDDLQCVFASLEGFLNAGKSENVQVFAAFDNEEVGSGTKQGALSTFLCDTLERINLLLGGDSEKYKTAVAESIMLSCDNAHAVHPNHTDKADISNSVYMNGGIVIKYNAQGRYTTDALSEAVVKSLCESAGVPYQQYANRSDMAGGSTLGNLSNEKVSLVTADIGLAQLAMHSSYETAGACDTTYMIKLIREFYSSSFKL